MIKLNDKYKIFVLVSFALLLVTSGNSIAATPMFLKLTGIPGDSVDSSHPNEIVILAESLEMNQTGTTVTGPQKPNAQNITFLKYVDESSPLLLTSCVTGKIIPSAILTIKSSSAKSPLEYLTISFTNVMVSSISSGASAGQDRPYENVSFSYQQYKVVYIPQKADGSADASISSIYDGTIYDAILTMVLSGSGKGSVNSITPGASFSCVPGSCSPQGFPYNTTMILSSVPSPISLLTSWSSSCNVVNGNCQVTLKTDNNVTATFTLADKARIKNLPGYASFAGAYNAASGGATVIMLLDDILPLETVINKVLVLQGGFNADFSRSITGYTILQGKLSIQNGKVTADRIIIQ
jgi:type VI secretion system secreted protein Hcp